MMHHIEPMTADIGEGVALLRPGEDIGTDFEWFFEDGAITWDEVWERWKARGPMNQRYVESIRRSRGQVAKWLTAA